MNTRIYHFRMEKGFFPTRKMIPLLHALIGFDYDGMDFKTALNFKYLEGYCEAAPQFSLQLVVIMKLGFSWQDWKGECILI